MLSSRVFMFVMENRLHINYKSASRKIYILKLQKNTIYNQKMYWTPFCCRSEAPRKSKIFFDISQRVKECNVCVSNTNSNPEFNFFQH